MSNVIHKPTTNVDSRAGAPVVETPVVGHDGRMAALGALAAGVAHEINTPIQFIGDNLQFIEESVRDFEAIFAAIEALQASATEQEGLAQALAETTSAAEQADLEYLRDELPKAIEQSISGVRRVARIVAAMKAFAHPGEESPDMTDLNELLNLTATISKNEWKYVAELDLDLAEELPHVLCFATELSQAILNLIVNAAQAIKSSSDGELGQIRIATRSDENLVEIEVADTGGGIPAEIRDEIFDPFFSTKPSGEGSGQGLAIAKRIIEERHQGTLTLKDGSAAGACFVARLPLAQTG